MAAISIQWYIHIIYITYANHQTQSSTHKDSIIHVCLCSAVSVSVVRQCAVFDKTFCFFHFLFSELRVENELTWLGL